MNDGVQHVSSAAISLTVTGETKSKFLAKLDYRRRIEDHLVSNNNRQVWQGVQHLTNYRINIGAAEGNTSLAEELNYFFARFEMEQPDTATHHPVAHSNFTLIVEEDENLLFHICSSAVCPSELLE
ncbi:RNA-directed DNA polymerase from mobile element jockey-like protein [Labeo rohita]|uniref:RNA-directed DNA polymerase from mobile element jockey-like protein n=1 Tax=Labeo rohita TaxID=84645 RepID=A0A498P0C1_LABRO|nr:RNA-directed DNA polymerase from mobile element jockey-like protein [Labeo rohita]